jgi:hypothetical protein
LENNSGEIMKKFWQSALLATVAVVASNTNVWAVGSQPAQKTERSSVDRLVQQQPLCLNIAFSNGQIIHRGRLVLGQNGQGMMRVSFRNARSGQDELIDEVMVMRNTPRGLVVLGYNPVFAGTNRRHPTYSADNFIIQRQNGQYVFFSVDDAGNQSHTDVSTC